MERTCATSSAASTSRSRLGSELKDSTGMPSRATSERATAPSIRLLIRLNWSRNIALSPLTQALQVALEEEGLADLQLRVAPLLPRLVAGEQVAGLQRPVLGRRQRRQALARLGVVRLAAQHLAVDPLRLPPVPLPQVELRQGGGGDRLGGGDEGRGLGEDRR